jgi:hypothetical protein
MSPKGVGFLPPAQWMPLVDIISAHSCFSWVAGMCVFRIKRAGQCPWLFTDCYEQQGEPAWLSVFPFILFILSKVGRACEECSISGSCQPMLE